MKFPPLATLLVGWLGLLAQAHGQVDGSNVEVESVPTPAAVTPADEGVREPVHSEPALREPDTTVDLGEEGPLPYAREDAGQNDPGQTSPSETPNDDGQTTQTGKLPGTLLDLTARLEALEQRLTDSNAGPQGADVAQIRQDLLEMTRTVSQLKQSIEDNLQSITQLRELLDDQQTLTQENTKRLQELAGATQGTDSGPTLWGNSQPSESARNSHFENMRYRLRIRNATGKEQPLTVNGVLWSVLDQEWSFVPVPPGPVTVQRPGLEPVELRENEIQWKSDHRGFFVEYDLSTNGVTGT